MSAIAASAKAEPRATPIAETTKPPNPAVPKNLHWVWVGDKLIDEHALANILECARLAPGFQKSIWTNDPKLIRNADRRAGSGRGPDLDLTAHLARAGIRVRPIDELLATPPTGFSTKDAAYLSSIVHRDIHAPLANRASASDVLRFLALHREGGVYADVDFAPHHRRDQSKPASIDSPTPAQQRVRTLASLRKTNLARLPNLSKPAESERPAIWAIMRRRLTQGKLTASPATPNGFALLGSAPLGRLNNSLLAAAPVGAAVQNVTARTLRMIVDQEARPLTLRSAEALRRKAPEIRLSPRHRLSLRKLAAQGTSALAGEHLTLNAKSGLLYAGVLAGKIDPSRFARLQTAIQAGGVEAFSASAARAGCGKSSHVAADRDLGLSWQAKRLRPRRQADVDAATAARTPSVALTQSMTGTDLLANAVFADERADLRGAKSWQRADKASFLRILRADAMQARHPFFGTMPPCDNPSLRALERIEYARDAP